ncbi:TIGR04255 family protein [Flavobacterium sp.]|uniref:TIGR04255 family protein n=1 Tax=Flavobacterium sp. TaxID=239 RepID=UPI0025D04C0B|nr:TIGR04255 family protein [Flavobacterium sp.]
MSVKYSKAPISEIIFGVVFKSNILFQNGVLFELLSELKDRFPNMFTHPSLGEEDVVNGLIQVTILHEDAGFSAYRLVSNDNKWQIIFHQNSFSLHWVRKDTEDVGNYPGFSNIFSEFLSIINLIKAKINDLDTHIKAYSLSYSDRVNLQEYEESGLSIFEIITIQTPKFSISKKEYSYNNFYSRYSVFCEEINGYSIFGINTPTLPIGQLLIIDNKLKGYNDDSIEVWFEKAHKIQTSFFENIFSETILKMWK